MATLQSVEISRRKPVAGFGAGGGQIRAEIARITVPAATATTDILQLFYLPPNARVVGGFLKAADLDTGATVTLNVGDAGNTLNAADADRYFAASTVGQAGGVVTAMAATGVDFFTGGQKMLVQAALAAGPSTTAGDIVVGLYYTVEEPQGAA